MSHDFSVNRRRFLEAGSLATAATLTGSLLSGTNSSAAAAAENATAESLTAHLFATLTPKQRETICFDWNHMDPKRGLLRTFVANNWNITQPSLIDDFYTADQQHLIREIFEAIIDPSWHERYDRQLQDDAGGFGHDQSIAIFGTPGEGKFELVLTGRHMTLRCDGNSADHVAFGGPIFYGHAPENNEGPTHIDNVFWDQAVAANDLYQMLSGKQQQQAKVPQTPREQNVGFQGAVADLAGLPVSDMSSDQRENLQAVLAKLVEPYRTSDRDEAMQCLKKQGGLDACHLMYFTDKDIGGDGVWDNWRLEGPSFVWHYRGAPHVHVWVNVADSAEVQLNA